mmetsp:Transcript_28710/g.50845  ORF Transcript_28710/g.50845 Transcript_28710/m.50845 type:complete len:287 (-) Transcript_28710:213-1073(-)
MMYLAAVFSSLLAVVSSFQATTTTTRRVPFQTSLSRTGSPFTARVEMPTTTTTRLGSTSYSQEECQTIRASLPSPLIDAQGNLIESAETIASLVQNQRVALYFAAGWSRHCRELDFMLAQYRNALRDSDQPIQLIYVPSDNTLEDQLERMQELGLELGVPVGEAADALKKQYGVWPDAEIEKFGGVARQFEDDGEYIIGDDDLEDDSIEMPDNEVPAPVPPAPTVAEVEMVEEEEQGILDDSGRRSGIPAFVVLNNKGKELCFLNTERETISALADWPLDDVEGHW